jgi:hypothetical protein
VAQELAGIAKNSCPLCGELTRVPLIELLPGKGPSSFRCSACKQRICVAKGAQFIAMFGGCLGAGSVSLALYRLVPWLDRLGWLPREGTNARGLLWLVVAVAIGAAYFAAAAPFGRLALRLEPAVDET